MSLLMMQGAMFPSGGGGGGGGIELADIYQYGLFAYAYSVQLPATVAAGDILVIATVSFGGNAGSNTPSGWTRQLTFSSGYHGGKTRIFTKVASGSEGGTTQAMTQSSGSGYVTYISARVKGAASASFFTGSIADRVSTTSATPPSPTASWGAAENLFVVFAFGQINLTATGYPLPDNQHTFRDPSFSYNPAYMCSKVENVAAVTMGALTFASTQHLTVATCIFKPA